jgi:hypothetical protein
MNATVPVGVPVAPEAGDTWAVKVIDCPTTAGFTEELKVVELGGSGFTYSEIAEETLAACASSPT